MRVQFVTIWSGKHFPLEREKFNLIYLKVFFVRLLVMVRLHNYI